MIEEIKNKENLGSLGGGVPGNKINPDKKWKEYKSFVISEGFIAGLNEANKDVYKGELYERKRQIVCAEHEEQYLEAYRIGFDEGYEEGYKIARENIEKMKKLGVKA